MLRSASSLSVKSGLLLLVLSSVVLSVATATESESHSLAPVEGGTQSVIAEGDFSPTSPSLVRFDLAQVDQDYELALASAQKQGVAGE